MDTGTGIIIEFTWFFKLIFLILYIPIIARKIKLKQNIKLIIFNIVFYLYILEVIGLVFFPIPLYRLKPVSWVNGINIIPFKTIITAWKLGIRIFLFNVIGNIALFFPLGILSPILFKKINNSKKIFMLALTSSFFIECTQCIINILKQFPIHGVDIDDILTNVSGALIGFVSYKLIHYFFNKGNASSNLNSNINLKSVENR